jgi:hypothetical protein
MPASSINSSGSPLWRPFGGSPSVTAIPGGFLSRGVWPGAAHGGLALPSMSAEPAVDGRADLGFLGALFGVFRPLRRDEERAFGVDVAVEPGSALAADDLAARVTGPRFLPVSSSPTR